MVVECHQCGDIHVDADVLIDYTFNKVPRQGPETRFTFLRCPKCEQPIVVSQDNIGNIAEGDKWSAPLRVYPPPDLPSVEAPEPIRTTFVEAVACFTARAHVATAIMCRKALEAACALHNVRERNLAKSLETMKAKGLIDSRLFEWADELRLAGNEAVHEVGATVSLEDARDMLDFTKAILDYLFSFRDKFEKFKGRRKRRPKDKP